jgi:hypothetical protein
MANKKVIAKLLDLDHLILNIKSIRGAAFSTFKIDTMNKWQLTQVILTLRTSAGRLLCQVVRYTRIVPLTNYLQAVILMVCLYSNRVSQRGMVLFFSFFKNIKYLTNLTLGANSGVLMVLGMMFPRHTDLSLKVRNQQTTYSRQIAVVHRHSQVPRLSRLWLIELMKTSNLMLLLFKNAKLSISQMVQVSRQVLA